MSIVSAISNAQAKIATAYTHLESKGATLPTTQDLANMPTCIDSISSGGGGTIAVLEGDITTTSSGTNVKISHSLNKKPLFAILENTKTSWDDYNEYEIYYSVLTSIWTYAEDTPQISTFLIAIGGDGNDIGVLNLNGSLFNKRTIFNANPDTSYNFPAGTYHYKIYYEV